MREIRTSGLMSGDGKRSVAAWPKPPRPSSTLHNPTRKRTHPFDRALYRRRNRIERLICRLKDWRRIATRYDKLAQNYIAAVQLAAIVTCRL